MHRIVVGMEIAFVEPEAYILRPLFKTKKVIKTKFHRKVNIYLVLENTNKMYILRKLNSIINVTKSRKYFYDELLITHL